MNGPLLAFIKKEFRQTLRDPRMKFLLFGVPIVQLLLFGFALSTDIKNIRLTFFYQKNVPQSEKIRQTLENAPEFILVAAKPKDRPLDLITSRRSEAVLIQDERGVQLLISAINNVRAQSIERYVKMLYREKGPSLPRPFYITLHYNPTLESVVYLVPGVMGMIVCVLTILLTSMSISKEKEMGTFEMLMASPLTTKEIVLGKTIPYFLLGIINIPLIIFVAVTIFDLPIRGSLLLIFIVSLLFVGLTVNIGVFISTFAQTQQQSMLGSFLFLFPAMMLSGLMFPLENMPSLLRWVAYINPLSHFISLMRNIFLKGGAPLFVVYHLTILFLLALLCLYINISRTKKQFQ